MRSSSVASVFPGSQAYPSQLSSSSATTSSMAPPVPMSYDQMDPRSSFSSAGGPIHAHHRQSHVRNDTMSTIGSMGSPMQTSPPDTIGLKRKRSSSSPDPDPKRSLELYGDVRDNKRPKFILVEDAARNQQRVRVRVTLDQVNLADIPDSYRRKLSVYPRAYFPMQFRETGAELRERSGGRWVEDGVNEINPTAMGAKKADADDQDGRALAGKMLVKLSNINGGEAVEETLAAGETEQMEVDPTSGGGPRDHGRRGTIGSVSSASGTGQTPRGDADYSVHVPGLTKNKRRREEMINELGVRMAWSQSRVFSGRILFLQKSLDAFRNKMKTTIMNSVSATEADESYGTTTSITLPAVNPHFETRVGKRRWLAGRNKAASKASDDDSDTERR